MSPRRSRGRLYGSALALLLASLISGCIHSHHAKRVHHDAPNELARTTLPPYVIAPPDVLLIDAVNLVPKPPYRIDPLDILGIQVTDSDRKPLKEGEPIAGLFTVAPEGTVDLGFSYGTVKLRGLTLTESRKAIEKHLNVKFKPPFLVTVELVQSKALQQIRGEHLVRPDGTVGLGAYGSVLVDGMTLEQAKATIEGYLSQFLLDPKISLDVAGFNSQVYYVITDGAGAGQQVYRLPVTGKETVLDAIAHINGLTPVSSKHHIWVARPNDVFEDITMAVDWNAITQRGRTNTNYQLMPGDRVYVMGAPLVTTDTYLARFLSPIERILGVTLLGRTTARAFQPGGLNSNNP
jgi:polysaccharide export outer membrane protein